MDTLLAGNLFPLQRVHCAGVNVQRRFRLWKSFRAHRENHSGPSRNPFAFPPELLFTISPESFSSSARNTFHVRPGIPFTLSRNPQLASAAWG
jgi:hypothetical protein